jgi:hypothetical protein
VVCSAVVAVGTLAAGTTLAHAQMTLTVPFKFEAAGKPLPAGDYWVGEDATGAITLRQQPKGVEVSLNVLKKLPPPTPPLEQPQLVFDMVGNFEPSYTEYVTDYLLSEVWLGGAEGLLVLETKSQHKHQVVKGQKASR